MTVIIRPRVRASIKPRCRASVGPPWVAACVIEPQPEFELGLGLGLELESVLDPAVELA